MIQEARRRETPDRERLDCYEFRGAGGAGNNGDGRTSLAAAALGLNRSALQRWARSSADPGQASALASFVEVPLTGLTPVLAALCHVNWRCERAGPPASLSSPLSRPARTRSSSGISTTSVLFELRLISLGISVTHCHHLQAIFDRLVSAKSYGASTTHMSQLLPKIEGGGGGGCPWLVFGIKDTLYDQNC